MQNKDRRRKEKPFLNQEIPCTEKKRINLFFPLPKKKKKQPAQYPLL